MHFESSRVIEADPDRVWAVLVDGAAWPTWDSGVEAVDGAIDLGNKITIRSAAAPGRSFPVRVTTFEPNRRLELTGGMPLGLFTGVRTYTLAADSPTATSLTVREQYRGVLLRVIARSMPDLQPSFDQFTAGLKQRVEGTGP